MRRRPGAFFAILALPAVLGAHRLHTELKESDPAENAVLTERPSSVTLTYTTDVQLALSTVELRPSGTGDGGPVPAGDLAYLADDRHDVLVLPLSEPLARGSYTVSWATAGPDGHRISGNFGFTVDAPEEAMAVDEEAAGADAEEEAAALAGDEASEGEAGTESGTQGASAQQEGAGGAGGVYALLVRVAFYAGLVGLLGALAFKTLVLGQAGRAGVPAEVISAATSGAWKIAVLALSALLSSLPFRLWFQAETFFPGDAAGNLFTVATGTVWGGAWWLQAALGTGAAAGLAMARRDGRGAAGWWMVALAVLLLPIVAVLSGHAWSDAPRPIAAGATYLHIVAAGSWVGGLFCLVFAGLPALRKGGGAETGERTGLARMVRAFSRVALFAVGLLVVTGATRAWIHLGTLSDLWTTEWGRSLLIKDLAVAGVMGLGFYNWRVVRPALEKSPRAGLLRGPALLELFLGAAAVVATSFMVVQPLS